MEKTLLAYHLHKEPVTTIMMINSKTKVKVCLPDGDTDFFDIVAGVLQGDTLSPYLFLICINYVLRTLIDLIKENCFALKKNKEQTVAMMDTDYADDIVVTAKKPTQAESLLHALQQGALAST